MIYFFSNEKKLADLRTCKYLYFLVLTFKTVQILKFYKIELLYSRFSFYWDIYKVDLYTRY